MGWWTVEWAAIHARRMESLCASSSCLLSLSLSQDHHQLEFPFIIIICALWTSWAPPLVLVHLLRLISTTAIKWTVSKWMVERQKWECPSVKTGEGIKDLRQEEQGKRKGGDNKAAAGFNWSEGTLGRQESSAHQRRGWFLHCPMNTIPPPRFGQAEDKNQNTDLITHHSLPIDVADVLKGCFVFHWSRVSGGGGGGDDGVSKLQQFNWTF